MVNEKYPKVLLICDFDQKSPSGITIRNLFQKWPKNSISVASFKGNINEIYTPNINRYYCFGYKETKFLWPFGILKNIKSSTEHFLDSEPQKLPLSLPQNKLIDVLKYRYTKFFISLLKTSGLSLISKEFQVSDSLNNWVCKFDPDIIYSSISDIRKMEFVYQIKKKYYNKKIVIHIMDDYINSVYNFTIFPCFWKKYLDKTFRSILSISDLNLCISEKMSGEYLNKYGKIFYAFHNPIEPDIWLNQKKIKHTVDNTFKFIYTGKLDRNTSRPIMDFIRAIEELNTRAQKAELQVYSADKEEVYRMFGEKAYKYYKGFVKNEELPVIISKADGLLLPLDFNQKSIQYTRLSFATKATEYMVSKIPIFVYAPRQIAITEYLEKYQAAFIIDKKDNLQAGILEFIRNREMRIQISDNAFKRAFNYHTTDKVSERLRDLLVSI